ncbi:MAG: glycoside hydrolase family 13 protein [Clostridia bacterium]|nr:glycoside hydrolase family 13 protein [Clostridia bacterium]
MEVNFNISSDSTPKGCHAFPLGDRVSIELSVAEMTVDSAWFYIGNDERVILGCDAEIVRYDNGFALRYDLDTVNILSQDGLYFCHFEFVSDGVRYYTAFDDRGFCYLDTHFVNETQILVYDEKYDSPTWLNGGVMYQIFPDRFSRGGEVTRRDDANYDEDWENGIPEYPKVRGEAFPNNTHFGGTLYGVADRMDYLSSLGVNCIYLNPIFEAYSNHKYDTADFLSVDKSFGGDEGLQFLIDKAHERGIKIILDGVFNHVGNDSIYFDAYGKYGTGACQSKDSPYFSWFKFHNYPDSYESWWGIKNLPRTVRCESYVNFITDEVIPKYMKMGIDGWRLDVADELESDFLDKIAKAVKSYKPDALIIGEVWEDASNKIAYDERKRYFRGKQLDSVTNYPVRNAIIDFVKYGNAEFLCDTLNTLYRNYPPHKLSVLMNFLGSHDTERIATVLGGESDMGEENDVLAVKKMPEDVRAKTKELLKSAYTLLVSLPGVPCIYYGDEIAMEGYHDPFNRKTFSEKGFSDSYSDHFKKVNNIRKNETLFTSTEFECVTLAESVLKITRRKDEGVLEVLANMSEHEYNYHVEKCTDIYNNVEYTQNITVKPKNVLLLKIG